MKFIGKILALVLLGINALVVLLMLVSAYSPYIDPYLHPMWSCSGLLFPVFLLANFLFLCFCNPPDSLATACFIAECSSWPLQLS